jgi:hypothetical protein
MRTGNIALLASLLLTIGTTGGTAVDQKASAPKPQDKVALGEENVKRLLLLMDADKNGKISKQEFMT